MLVSIGLVRIVHNFPLYKILLITYGIICLFAIFASDTFVAIAFDSSGATTGAVTVPFLLALGAGISALKKDSKASEKDSFGIVGLASAGAIISVLVASVITDLSIDPNLSNNGSETVEISASIIQPFINKLPTVLFEAFLAIFPIFFIYMLFQLMYLKQPKRAFRRVIFGLLFAFIGLVLFMLGVHAGFLDVGRIVGSTLSEPDNKFLLIAIAFGLGLFTVLPSLL